MYIKIYFNVKVAPNFAINPYTASFNENESPGYVVQTVVATDTDIGTNGDITYSISAGNTGSAFSIDPASGGVSIFFFKIFIKNFFCQNQK